MLVLQSHPYSLLVCLHEVIPGKCCSSFFERFLANCIVQNISLEVWTILCWLRMQPSTHLLLWFIHCCIPRSSSICWSISLLWVCWLLLQSEIMAFCLLLWPGLASCSLAPNIMNRLSLEYRSKVLHILILIPQWVLPWVVYPAIDLRLLLFLVSLCRLLYLILLGLFPSNLSCDPIHVFLVTFWISSCWIDVWRVKCTLVNLLGLSCLVPFRFPHCSILCYLLFPLP